MASATPICENSQVDSYLQQIATGLGPVDTAQKEEILAEIHSHLDERISELKGEGDANAVAHALAALGNPDALAAQFVAEVRMRSGPRSYVPWTLLRRAARIAGSGIRGFLVFSIGLIGYSGTLGLLFAVAMKPFEPRVGFWIGDWGFGWGLPAPGMHGRELLGNYFMPVTSVVAFIFACVTTLLLRRMLSKVSFFGKWPIQQSSERQEFASGLHQ